MELIQINQKISLNIEKEDKLVQIIGTIEQVFEDRLVVDLPSYFMRYIECLDVGKTLTAKVFSKLGTIDFNTIVISSPLENGTLEIEFDYNALKLTPNTDIPKIDAIETMILYNNEFNINCKTFEISTENIKFYSDKPLEINTNYDCELILSEDYGTIKFKITIMSVDIVYDNEYTATYFSMNEQSRETLLYYMYEYSNRAN